MCTLTPSILSPLGCPFWVLVSISNTQFCFQALTRLCEQTECDVRSCLNTLQFLARKGRPIKVADLNGLSIGQKDISKGAFSIWQDLTQIKVAFCALTCHLSSHSAAFNAGLQAREASDHHICVNIKCLSASLLSQTCVKSVRKQSSFLHRLMQHACSRLSAAYLPV